jgi:hypothetical protein
MSGAICATVPHKLPHQRLWHAPVAPACASTSVQQPAQRRAPIAADQAAGYWGNEGSSKCEDDWGPATQRSYKGVQSSSRLGAPQHRTRYLRKL